MQTIIEEVIRWLGYAALRVVTLGRYRGGREDDRLPEGALGFGVIVVVASVIYAVWR